MNREQIIADLILHGYVPYADIYGWVKIWSVELDTGRMCKFFENGVDGPGWDVRALISRFALTHAAEVPWHRIDDDQLAQLTAAELPPKFRHDFNRLAALPERLDEK
jgi:hypothetical protein